MEKNFAEKLTINAEGAFKIFPCFAPAHCIRGLVSTAYLIFSYLLRKEKQVFDFPRVTVKSLKMPT